MQGQVKTKGLLPLEQIGQIHPVIPIGCLKLQSSQESTSSFTFPHEQLFLLKGGAELEFPIFSSINFTLKCYTNLSKIFEIIKIIIKY